MDEQIIQFDNSWRNPLSYYFISKVSDVILILNISQNR